MDTSRKERLSHWGSLTMLAAYLLALLEIAFMSTPFAAYYYAAYSPVLAVIRRSRHTSWLSEFFVTHLSVPDSVFLVVFKTSGVILAGLGLVVFLVHAVYLYWLKFARNTVASRLLYTYVRHPQYSSLMVAGLGVAIMWPRFINLLLFLAMTLAYNALARYEERRLMAKLPRRYRDYAEGKSMFLPGDPATRLISRFFGWLPEGPMRSTVATAAMFTMITISAFGLRSYSVAKLKVYFHPESPGVLVIALDPPDRDDHQRIARDAAQHALASSNTRHPPSLLLLIWESDRLRHFLIDSGFHQDMFDELEIPPTGMFLIEASIHEPGVPGHATRIGDPNKATRLTVIRRLERIQYLVPNASNPSWKAISVPIDSLHAHASLPIL